MKTLDKQIARTSQGIHYLEHIEVKDDTHAANAKLRVDIYSDSYKNQGHCRLDAFDAGGLKWHNVASRPPTGMATSNDLCHEPDLSGSRNFTPDFAADRKWLLDLFLKLTGGVA